MGAVETLRQGHIAEALEHLTREVRDDPANPKLRVFMFQLLAVSGQWDRSLSQLKVLQGLDVATLPMVATYREAIRCELLRTEVFAGRKSPLLLGDPPGWSAQMVEALRLDSEGKEEAAAASRSQAMEVAAPSTGTIDGESFDWIADADGRLGPILEAVINGRYYWVPFDRVARIRLEPPSDLRDLVWLPAEFSWWNEGEVAGLIPARYPTEGPESDPALLLARRTEWNERNGHGLGQRMLATDVDDYPLLDIREITFEPRGT